ncbi:MAG: hypothetical protein N2646_01015 [Bellilinea sp.]|nr:hypothetical protein [Bellilinea sp.]
MEKKPTLLRQLLKGGMERLRGIFQKSRSSSGRSPELAELEAQFYRNGEEDPEKLKNRMFSNSIRSGRG